MVVGVDVVGDKFVDRFFGPNKKKMRQNASHGHVADANTQRVQEIPTTDDKADDLEARIDSSTNHQVTRVPYFRITRSSLCVRALPTGFRSDTLTLLRSWYP